MIRDYSNPMPEYFDTPDEGPLYYDLEFTYIKPPLNANQRLHHMAKARLTAGIRQHTEALARRIPYLGRCEVTLTWHVNTKHRRDADNIVPTLKAMCDGLVDAGIVHDDTPNYMTKLMPVITYEPDTTPRLVLRVARILPEAAAA